MYCLNCGKEIPDHAKFCSGCGAKVEEGSVNSAPAKETPVVQEAPPVVQDKPQRGKIANADRITYRVKCPSCGTVQDAKLNYVCKSCGQSHSVDLVNHGFLQIYRMGHFSGSMAGQSIYLNTEPMGMVGNASSVIIELAPGQYNVHLAISMCRNCDDLVVNITPGEIVYLKSQMKMGMIKNKILIHPANAVEMPPLA